MPTSMVHGPKDGRRGCKGTAAFHRVDTGQESQQVKMLFYARTWASPPLSCKISTTSSTSPVRHSPSRHNSKSVALILNIHRPFHLFIWRTFCTCAICSPYGPYQRPNAILEAHDEESSSFSPTILHRFFPQPAHALQGPGRLALQQTTQAPNHPPRQKMPKYHSSQNRYSRAHYLLWRTC